MKLYAEQQWLKEQFDITGITISAVANKVNCNEKTIRRYMKKYGISSRSRTETASIRQSDKMKISDSVNEIIEGELLGDGNLDSRRAFSARYRHSSKYRGYLNWLLNKLGLKHCRISNSQNGSYHVATATYADLYSLYQKWYTNRKIIPSDLILTPVMCLHWYLGDGSLNYKTICRIAACNFSKAELKTIVFPQLDAFNPRFHKNGKYHRLALDSSFLDYIGPCPSDIKELYEYKWQWPK